MRADAVLDALGYDYDHVEQDEPTEACDAAADQRGLETGQIVKSLIVSIDGQDYHLLVPGDRQLSERKVGSYRLVEPDRSTELTGCEPGTVHPFASELPHRVDYRLFLNEEVSFTVGNRQEGVIIDAERFRDALDDEDFEWVEDDLVSFTEQDVRALDSYELDEETATFIAKEGYTRVFEQLVDDVSISDLVMAIESLHREEVSVSPMLVDELIERAEGETHMQRLAAHRAEHGEWPEDVSYDLDAIITEILTEHENAVQDYRDGKSSAVNFLMGQVMNETQGQADPGSVRRELMSRLED
ncbi:MAG: hypothetical protein MUP66_00560 [Candidatus Nanohaloarchaeota archaeon QJJ-5]|nr:hypothetical protein [Candidatus Nanohaloarchaeota archaeon QJJ-5]